MIINSKRSAVVITAGGSGLRMGGNVKKQYVELSGKPVLYYSIKFFCDMGFSNIILTLPEEDLNFVRENILIQEDFKNVATVAGGRTRHHSIYNGLKKLKNIEYVFIHDGVRPLVTGRIMIDLYNMLDSDNNIGVIPVLPVKDTLKKIKDGFIEGTLDRKDIVAVQTPQAFPFEKIMEAYSRFENELEEFTDDAAIYEKAGYKVKTVKGDYRNIKITTNEDLQMCEFIKTKMR